MTLSLITTASSFSSTSHCSGFVDTANNYFLTVSSGNNFRRFNMGTGAQVGTDIAVTSGAQTTALITPASALILTSGTTHDFIELSSGYRQAVAGGGSSGAATFTTTTNNNTAGYQLSATDGSGTVLYVRSSNTSLGKVASSGQTFSNLVVQQGISATFTSIIYKGNGRFLVGDNYGRVYEIDTSGNLYQSTVIPLGPMYTNRPPSSSLTSSGPRIISLAYENDILVVGTELGIFVLQYSTRQVIKFTPGVYTAGSPSSVLSQMVSGVVVTASNGNNSSTLPCTLREVDCTIDPLKVRSKLFQSQAGTFTSQIQINPVTGNGIQVYTNTAGTSNFIAFFTVVPRSSTTRTINVTPNGSHAQFRLLVIDATNGVGQRKLIFDTLGKSPYTYRVPTGKNLIELIGVGEGANTKWAYGRFLT